LVKAERDESGVSFVTKVIDGEEPKQVETVLKGKEIHFADCG
jgi:hypothetical protein